VGTGLDVLLTTTGDDRFGVTIDGKAFPSLTLSGAAKTTRYTLASNLAAGEHDVTIVKLTEHMVGTAQFSGFVPAGGKLLATRAPVRRRLEFIGDSITAGYGDQGVGPNCHFAPRRRTQRSPTPPSRPRP